MDINSSLFSARTISVRVLPSGTLGVRGVFDSVIGLDTNTLCEFGGWIFVVPFRLCREERRQLKMQQKLIEKESNRV